LFARLTLAGTVLGIGNRDLDRIETLRAAEHRRSRLLTIGAMFVRNLALLLIFSPAAGFIAAVPIGLMALSAAAFICWEGRAAVDSAELAIGSPISLRQLTPSRQALRAIPTNSPMFKRDGLLPKTTSSNAD
jgi:hypothetical protein